MKKEKVEEYKRKIKLKLTNNIEDVLDELVIKVDKKSSVFNEIVQQKGRLNKIRKDDRIGVVAYETSTIEFNRIRFSTAEIISNLTESDFIQIETIDEVDELESLFEEAENINKKAEFEKEKGKILSGSTGLHFAIQEFKRLFTFSKEIQEIYKTRTNYFFNSMINKERNKFIVYGEDGIALRFTWHQHYFDSLQRSKLFVEINNNPTPLERERGAVIFYEKELKRLDYEELNFDFSEGWIKGWNNQKTNNFYETKSLIEEKFKQQLRLIIKNKKKK